jgi:hypothetical protein
MFGVQGQDTRPDMHAVRSEKEALAILGVRKTQFDPIQLK